jgi:NTP pyrophosphatase (non-canonical NTP hydrolase)
METHDFDKAVKDRQGDFHDTNPTIAWWTLALVGEAGELANKVKKIWRDDQDMVTDQRRHELLCELGDVLAYSSALAQALGANLDVVMHLNLLKVQERIERGTQKGSGDNR